MICRFKKIQLSVVDLTCNNYKFSIINLQNISPHLLVLSTCLCRSFMRAKIIRFLMIRPVMYLLILYQNIIEYRRDQQGFRQMLLTSQNTTLKKLIFYTYLKMVKMLSCHIFNFSKAYAYNFALKT